MPNRTFYGEMDPNIPEGMTNQKIITEETIQEGTTLLQKYKQGKINLESRVINDELWWKLRHWENYKKESEAKAKPTSAWLVNAILNKHADAMDNYPEPVVLPREQSDEQSARILSSVLPVILETNDFQETYDNNWYRKLKHGTAVYGAFWNPKKENGLGDIDIKAIDLLNVFWEPGIQDIQKSKNLFITELVDNDTLDEEYPEFAGRWAKTIDIGQYVYDDNVDTTNKSVVVDWYYKSDVGGKTVLQLIKFCGDNLLYASENDPYYRDNGWYAHGMYPVVFDTLYPEEGTPVGWGYVALCKEPQIYIDQLSGNILENTLMSSKKRFFVKESMSINEEEFTDWNNQIIHVAGDLEERNIKEFVTNPLDPIVVTVMNNKIEEMKDTASNRDVNSGGSAAGVTAAAAIAALQEAGNKVSRDMISQSYNAYSQLIRIVIELVRQFYDEPRTFRIIAPNGMDYQFIAFSNQGLQDQVTGIDAFGTAMIRKPIFDLKVKAQKKNPFSRMEQNERMKEMFQIGVFNPERAQEAMIMLEGMEFEGIDKVKEMVTQGATLLNMVQQLSMENAQLKGAMGIMQNPSIGATNIPQGTNTPSPEENAGNQFASGLMPATKPMTGYGERLAKRSVPSIE